MIDDAKLTPEAADLVEFLEDRYHTALCREYRAIPLAPGVVKQIIDTLERIIAERDELLEKTRCTLGVGDGSGRLFIHGDYESVKAAQRFIFRAEQAESERDTWSNASKAALDAAELSEDRATKAESERDAASARISELEGRIASLIVDEGGSPRFTVMHGREFDDFARSVLAKIGEGI